MHQTLPPEYSILPATAEDQRWIELMVEELHGWPKHSGTKHSSVITGPDGHFRSLGFNGLPRGLDDSSAKFTQHPGKRENTKCAERNAIANLQMLGQSAEGCTLHSDAVPCALCVEAIIKNKLAAVVLVNLEVASETTGDDYWRADLRRLLDAGIEIRQHDPAIERYGIGVRKIRHPPIPSGAVDWDSRFLALAKYLERWQGHGTGEVLAHRPGGSPCDLDKIVASLGVWGSQSSDWDAFETARLSNIALGDCTLYLSNPAPLADRARIAQSRISHVILPDTYRSGKYATTLAGITIGYHHVTPQDYASLVRRHHPAPNIQVLANAELSAIHRNEDGNHVV